MQKPLCVIVGVGPGNGAALARRFVEAHYRVALLARSEEEINQLAAELDNTFAYACDVSQPDSIHQVFNQIKQELGEIETVIYNAGSGTWGTIEEITADDFTSSWRINSLGLLLVSQLVIPNMKHKGNGNIIIIGATASKRGGIKTAAFAPAKAAQRSLAESMAKYLWPLGIHVALLIIDGIIDLPRTRKQMPDKPDHFFVKPKDVADTAFYLTQQSRSTWTFELEIRPFIEVW